jgi:hypothetical protein
VVKGRGGKTTKKNNKGGTKRITKTTRIRTTYYKDTYMLRSKKTNLGKMPVDTPQLKYLNNISIIIPFDGTRRD